jgi:multidrug efflux pump subunit AcrB
MGLIKASLKNPYMVATIVFLIVFLGYKALLSIPKDILPVFKTPAVQVLTFYQGMPASSVEKTITNRVERWVNQAPGAEKVESRSVPGVSVVKVYFRDDIDPNAALTLTNSLALGTLPTLPPNTLPPVVLPFDPTATMPLAILTVSNENLDEARIKDLARIEVRNLLGQVPGCVAPVVVGGKDRTILIYLKPKEMEVRKVSPMDVVRALQKGNLMVSPGTAYFGDSQVLLDTNVLVKKVEELNDLPIRTQPNDNVYLRDVGHAEDSYSIQTSRVLVDGRREVYVPIYRQQGASSLAVAKGVRAHIPKMLKSLPEGTKLDLIMDQSEFVQGSIDDLVQEGVLGAFLVGVMILLFLGNGRMTAIACTSIPLSVLGAIVGLYVFGNTINAMTLGGLALAVGPLVDDAIVALENIHRHGGMGKSRLRAALDGSVEVMVPVLIATCTTTIVLAPLALLPGMGGFLFRPLALAVAFAMFTSFLLSRTFVPMMCAKFLREHAPPGHGGDGEPHTPPPTFFGQLHHRFERGLGLVNAGYAHLLQVALRHRAFVLLLAGLLFVGSLLLTFGIGREFFPPVDAGQITLYVRAPSKLRLDATERRILDVERFIRQEVPPEDLEMIVSEIGLDPDWSAAYTANAGQQDAVVRVQLKPKRRRSSQEYAIQLRHAFAAEPSFDKLSFSFNTGGMVSTALNFGASTPIDIAVTAPNKEKAEKVMEFAEEVRSRAAAVPGAVDVRVAQRLNAPYRVIEVDRVKAARHGLSAQDVILQVVAAMNSSVSISRNFWIDMETGNQYFVGVQYPEDPNRRLEDVLNIPATGTYQTEPVKLSTLAKLHPKEEAVEINHVSLTRTFNVQVNVEGRDLGSVARDVKAALADLPKPKGMDWEVRGEYDQMTTSTSHLLGGLFIAVVLVYLLLMALFRSWVGPFIIVLTVPLGLIGVFTMLFVTRTTLNVQSQMGVIFLVGIAVNNGVLLVDFANKQRRLGAPVFKAIGTAASIRFRPILMTFLATFLDLIPMAIGIGRGSEANVPLARAVVGGLLTSTALTLFVVPILYTLFLRDPLPPEVDLEAELAGATAGGLPREGAPHAPSADGPSAEAITSAPGEHSVSPNGDPGR